MGVLLETGGGRVASSSTSKDSVTINIANKCEIIATAHLQMAIHSCFICCLLALTNPHEHIFKLLIQGVFYMHFSMCNLI